MIKKDEKWNEKKKKDLKIDLFLVFRIKKLLLNQPSGFNKVKLEIQVHLLISNNFHISHLAFYTQIHF